MDNQNDIVVTPWFGREIRSSWHIGFVTDCSMVFFNRHKYYDFLNVHFFGDLFIKDPVVNTNTLLMNTEYICCNVNSF